MKVILFSAVVGFILLLFPGHAAAADWPMWRYDAGRSAVTNAALPKSLELQWKLELLRPVPAWPEEQGKVRFDVSYNIIVSQGRVIVPSMVEDHVTAYDAVNGQRLWRVYTEGPVRFAAVASAEQGVVLFGSDDGYLYCVDAENGSLKWKWRSGPDARRVLGNDRLISMWPVRGAPVIAEGTVYFAAGIWPFMGVFIHAVDIATGEIIWTNSGTGSNYIVQQHNSPAFAGVAPQGYLTVADDTLLVTGGMTVPAALDRSTGKFRYFRPGDRVLGKDPGGFEVIAGAGWFSNHGGLYRTDDGKPLVESMVRAVTDEFVVAQEDHHLQILEPALSTKNVTVRDKKGKEKIEKRIELRKKFTSWLPEPVSQIYFLAGEQLFAGDGDRTVFALEMPKRAGQGVPIVWQTSVEAPVWDVVAANDRLYVVDTIGSIYCFANSNGTEARPVTRSERSTFSTVTAANTSSQDLDSPVLRCTQEREGYAIIQDGEASLLNSLVTKTNFHIVALESRPESCNSLRREMDERGLLGSRVAVLPGDISEMQLPPYMAQLIVARWEQDLTTDEQRRRLDAMFRSLRPYGGVAAIACHETAHANLVSQWMTPYRAEADLKREGSWTMLRRPGPLPGAASWTHQNADAANSLVSQDRLVQAPLGLLWFGGPSNREVLPRHGHGPVPQVTGGRLFIEGRDMLRAVDVYTGRLIWQRAMKDLGVYYNNTGHHPGAGAIGGNYVSLADGIYVIWGRRCLRLNPATGQTIREFTLPADDSGERPVWGFVAVDGDYLVAGSSPMVLLAESSSYPTRNAIFTRFGEGSHRIVVMDRHSGKVLWHREAEFNFRHNAIAIADGRLFCIDRMTTDRLANLERRGLKPQGRATLYALDLKDGKEHWKTTDGVFGTWLSYSAKHQVLVQAGSKNRDRANDETGSGMAVYAADDGRTLWQNDLAYAGPLLLHGDDLITQGTAFDLLTGQPKQRIHPLTGESQPWKFTRNYGCTTAIGCVNLLTFRSAAAGYFDLTTDGGTGNWGGFRSSCTANLIPADGLLNAPDYTRTCTCSYQNQCSLALVHMPDVETWTFNSFPRGQERVKQVGINFGAPGDRRAPDGTLWLDYPSVGGLSPDLPISIQGDDLDYSRHHSSQVKDHDPNWVFASHVRGVRELRITLAHASQQMTAEKYRVRLFFATEADGKSLPNAQQIRLQGRDVTSNCRVDGRAKGGTKGFVCTCDAIEIGRELRVTLQPPAENVTPPALCGIEIVHETLVTP